MEYKYIDGKLVNFERKSNFKIKDKNKARAFWFNIGSIRLHSRINIEFDDNHELPYDYLIIVHTAELKNNIWITDLLELIQFMKDFDIKQHEYDKKEDNVWNNSNLVSFVFDVLEKIHYSGLTVKKSED